MEVKVKRSEHIDMIFRSSRVSADIIPHTLKLFKENQENYQAAKILTLHVAKKFLEQTNLYLDPYKNDHIDKIDINNSFNEINDLVLINSFNSSDELKEEITIKKVADEAFTDARKQNYCNLLNQKMDIEINLSIEMESPPKGQIFNYINVKSGIVFIAIIGLQNQKDELSSFSFNKYWLRRGLESTIIKSIFPIDDFSIQFSGALNEKDINFYKSLIWAIQIIVFVNNNYQSELINNGQKNSLKFINSIYEQSKKVDILDENPTKEMVIKFCRYMTHLYINKAI